MLLGAPPAYSNSIQENPSLSQKVLKGVLSPLFLNGIHVKAVDFIKYLGISIAS